uniref:Uncharacterized protein n=1 Tax=Ditylum brightwellii TaxID=49249 RepID=A0A7S4SDN7_9STRA
MRVGAVVGGRVGEGVGFKVGAVVGADVYTFFISDNYGDGICCEHGSGSYNLSLGETTFIEGGEFSSSMQNKFVLVEQDTVKIQMLLPFLFLHYPPKLCRNPGHVLTFQT